MMDDIFIHGHTRQEHDDHLREVLGRLQETGVTLNAEKCEFAQSSVKFLGHLIDASGIRPDPDKVIAIQKVRPPANVGDVRRFLGMVNQMNKFVPNLAEITKPLRDLLVKDNQWVWGEPQQQAFTQIKDILTTTPVPSSVRREPRDSPVSRCILLRPWRRAVAAAEVRRPEARSIYLPLDDGHRTKVCPDRRRWNLPGPVNDCRTT